MCITHIIQQPHNEVIHTISKVIHTTKHSKQNTFIKLLTLQYKVINTIIHSIKYNIYFLIDQML